MEITMPENLSRSALPLSLKKRRTYQIIMRSIACALLLAIFVFVIIMWGNRIFPTTQKHHLGYAGLKIMFYIVFLLIPFIITGIPFKLIDKSWSGTVTDIKIVENLGTTSCPAHVHPYPKQDLILTITKDNGKRIKYTQLSLVDKNLHGQKNTPIGNAFYHEHKYKVGDIVHKYYGFKHLYFVSLTNQNHKNCIRCGSQNKMQDTTCWYCNSELIT